MADIRDPAQRPKGRPTPPRKQTEQARRKSLKTPADPKAAKKALRQREREDRARSRAGLMAGDARYLPPRDQGPAKAFTRDFVDSKRHLSEFFVFFAVGILLAGFIRPIQGIMYLLWFAVTLVVVGEVTWVLLKLRRELTQRWPEKSDRKGCLLYATLRCLQLRKLRVPPPRVKAGGAPVEKKG